MVTTIEFSGNIFKDVRVGLVHDLTKGTLIIYIQEHYTKEYDSKIEFKTGRLTVLHSASKKHVQILSLWQGTTITLDSTAEGEQLVDRLQQLCDCLATVE